MEDLTIRTNELLAQMRSIQDEVEMLQQPRSNFALRHFVVGQHDMPGRQRAQAIIELQVKLFTIKRSMLDQEELEIRMRDLVDRLNNTSDDTDNHRLTQIAINRLELDESELYLARLGSIREAEYLMQLIKNMPAYTREQLEQEEAEYWSRRLSRQFYLGQRDSGGNLDAILQVITEPGQAKPPVPIDMQTLVDLVAPMEDQKRLK